MHLLRVRLATWPHLSYLNGHAIAIRVCDEKPQLSRFGSSGPFAMQLVALSG